MHCIALLAKIVLAGGLQTLVISSDESPGAPGQCVPVAAPLWRAVCSSKYLNTHCFRLLRGHFGNTVIFNSHDMARR